MSYYYQNHTFHKFCEEINFGQLVDALPALTETQQNQELIRQELAKYHRQTFLYAYDTTENPENGTVFYRNLAAVFAWFGQLAFLDIILRIQPSLMWQRVPLGCNNDTLLTTPLCAAVHSRSLSLVEAILAHPVLTDYAKRDSLGYTQLIDHGISQCLLWFTHPMAPEEATITTRLQSIWIDNILQ